MVRSGRYQYVKCEEGTEYLYDLEADPYELKPIKDDKVLEEMRDLLRRWKS